MEIEQESDLRYIISVLPAFGERYRGLVLCYAQLFGISPMALKTKKIRLLLEDMKRLFDAQAFSYQKKTYKISHAGIGQALDVLVKKHWPEPLENHNYLKKVMIGIAEQEEKEASRAHDAAVRQREDLQRAGHHREDPAKFEARDCTPAREDRPEPARVAVTEEQRLRNLTRVSEIIKSIGG